MTFKQKESYLLQLTYFKISWFSSSCCVNVIQEVKLPYNFQTSVHHSHFTTWFCLLLSKLLPLFLLKQDESPWHNVHSSQ